MLSTKEDKRDDSLNKKQRLMAEMLANPENEKKTVTDMCRELGISRNTFYTRWINDDRFNEYVERLIAQYTDAQLGAVWKALIDKCKEGNVNAIKLFFELKGRYKQSVDISGSAAIVISGEDRLED